MFGKCFYDNNRIRIDWRRKNNLGGTFSRISPDAAEHPTLISLPDPILTTKTRRSHPRSVGCSAASDEILENVLQRLFFRRQSIHMRLLSYKHFPNMSPDH